MNHFNPVACSSWSGFIGTAVNSFIGIIYYAARRRDTRDQQIWIDILGPGVIIVDGDDMVAADDEVDPTTIVSWRY